MPDDPENAVLRGLSEATHEHFQSYLTKVELEVSSVLHRADGVLDWVYFPETSLLSTIVTGLNGDTVETAMVGNEGAAGLVEACASQMSGAECVVQVDGDAWRAPAKVCRMFVDNDPAFRTMTLKSAELQLLESRQSVFCQAMHSVERRFARWLCESADRCGGRNPIPMTQRFLASLLGVQRTTVTGFAGTLQKAGVIHYRRGLLQITDRLQLESLACECRDISLSQRKRLGFETSCSAGRLFETSPIDPLDAQSSG